MLRGKQTLAAFHSQRAGQCGRHGFPRERREGTALQRIKLNGDKKKLGSWGEDAEAEDEKDKDDGGGGDNDNDDGEHDNDDDKEE